eukprot:4700276-Amphidinium_carterae.2
MLKPASVSAIASNSKSQPSVRNKTSLPNKTYSQDCSPQNVNNEEVNGQMPFPLALSARTNMQHGGSFSHPRAGVGLGSSQTDESAHSSSHFGLASSESMQSGRK